jgi:hypothetical protein
MATMAGYDVGVNQLGPCASSILQDDDLQQVVCLLGVTEIQTLNSDSLGTDCRPISTLGITLKSYHVSVECTEGWTKGPSGVCEQVTTTPELTSGICVMALAMLPEGVMMLNS